MGYGPIQLQKTAFLFDLLDNINPADVVESENPLSMESVGQVFNFIILSIYMYFFKSLCFVAILTEQKLVATWNFFDSDVWISVICFGVHSKGW